MVKPSPSGFSGRVQNSWFHQLQKKNLLFCCFFRLEPTTEKSKELDYLNVKILLTNIVFLALRFLYSFSWLFIIMYFNCVLITAFVHWECLCSAAIFGHVSFEK